jgi:hypothetical protein
MLALLDNHKARSNKWLHTAEYRLVGRTGIEPVTLGLRVRLPQYSMVSYGFRKVPIIGLILLDYEPFDKSWFSMLAAEVTGNRPEMKATGHWRKACRQAPTRGAGRAHRT